MRFDLKRTLILGLLAGISATWELHRGGGYTVEDAAVLERSDDRGYLGPRKSATDVNRREVWDIVKPRRPPCQGDPVDDSPIPGSGGESGAKPPAFPNQNLESARTKGEQFEKELDDAIFKARPDTGNTTPLKDSGYKVDIIDEPLTEKKYLKDFGIDFNKEWTTTNVYKDEIGTIVMTAQDAEQGAITILESWNKNKDPNGVGWTTMVMDNWRSAARNGEVQNLKHMIRDNIQSLDTVDSKGIKLNTVNAMRESFDKMKHDRTETLTLDAKSDNQDELACFQLMAAQTHVARVFQMLKDYHNELGNLKVTKLHLQTNDHKNRSFQWNMIIEFEK